MKLVGELLGRTTLPLPSVARVCSAIVGAMNDDSKVGQRRRVVPEPIGEVRDVGDPIVESFRVRVDATDSAGDDDLDERRGKMVDELEESSARAQSEGREGLEGREASEEVVGGVGTKLVGEEAEGGEVGVEVTRWTLERLDDPAERAVVGADDELSERRSEQ